MVGNESEEIDDSKCFSCKEMFGDDIKSVAQCTVCNKLYHVRCENIDLRGFHLRKSYWKCKICENKNIEEGTSGKQNRSRKRSRTEENYLDQIDVDFINSTLQALVKNTNELNTKIDFLIKENNELRKEIISLKQQKHVDKSSEVPSLSSYSSVVQRNVNKVLVIKPKETQKHIKEVKEDLRKKVDPTDMGMGVTMGRVTKKGGLILNCDTSKDILNIQSEIQSKLGDTYDVERPKTLQHRIKIVGVDAGDYESEDSALIAKVITQNDLINSDSGFSMKVIRRTKLIKSKFNLVIELDQCTYSSVMDIGKINIGWNRCPVYNEYGIVRCFNCCKYGHFAKECKEKQVCPKCSEEHNLNDCHSSVLKCSNCLVSNNKYGLTLNVDHTTWDRNECETLKRIENLQIQKYQK